MKSKALVVVAVLAALAVAAAIVMMAKPKGPKMPAVPQPAAPAKAAMGGVKAPAKSVISKDMGGLTIKVTGMNKREINVRGKAFRAVDGKSSVFVQAISTNRLQELAPGTYDIELETSPAKLYKNINVGKGRETVEDLGSITGAVNVKHMAYSKKASSVPVKVLNERSGMAVSAGVANKPVEVVAGVYDLQIESAPRQVMKGIRVEAGKEAAIDLGASGLLRFNVVDENGKEARAAVKIRKAKSSEVAVSGASNKPIEMLAGTYDIEIASRPAQTKNDVKIVSGEETVVDFTVKAPPAPAPKPSAPAKPAAQQAPAIKK